MARITNSNVYPNDAEITGQDKWLGTDAATNTVKNFTVEDVARYLAQSGAADPSRLAFTFDYAGDYVSGQILQNGQFTYELQSGMVVSPAAVNYIRVSAETNVGTNVAGIIPVLLNSLLKLTDNLNPFSNDYSFYEVQGYETITEGGLTTYRIQVNFVSNAASRSRLITNSIALTPFGYQSVESVVIPSGDTNILSGINDPNSAVASATVGSFYIRYDGTAENPVNLRIYGPYTASGGWGTPITLKGDKGDTGAPGPTGPSGANGRNGINGVDGRDGVDGTNGRDGVDGTPGRGWTSGSYDSSTGVVTFNSNDGLGFSTTDLRGQDGNDGADGRDGRDGQDGAPGTDGSDGTDGVNGAQGVQGAYFIEAYADQATAPTQAPTSGSGTVNANSAQLTAAPTTTESGVTYLTSVPASVTNTLYITRSVYNPADNSIGAWSVPFPAATGAAGPQGPPGAQGAAGTNGADGATGPRGRGWTGGSYDTSTGIVTFTSTDGLGFSTGDLRGADGNDGNDGAAGSDGSDGNDGAGWTGGSYDSTTGVVTFASSDGLGFSTGDLRGADGADGAPGQDGADGNDGTNGTNGRDGVDGADGENGESITVVTQEANDADGNARVSFGTETTSVINTITIPKGPTGAAGTDGDDLSATITNTPASGDTPASNTVIISTNGTETGRFTVSDGAAGAPGAQGERGPNILDATTGVTTTGDNAFTADRIPEGETNQYYTDAKADARVEAGVLDWAETGNTDTVPSAKLPESARLLPVPTAGSADQGIKVNGSESGYEFVDIPVINSDGNLEQADGEALNTDSLAEGSTNLYATRLNIDSILNFTDPSTDTAGTGLFLNRNGQFGSATVGNDSIDNRLNALIESWAFISNGDQDIPESKLPEGAIEGIFTVNHPSTLPEGVPSSLTTSANTSDYAKGDTVIVREEVGGDLTGRERTYVFIGANGTGGASADWQEIEDTASGIRVAEERNGSILSGSDFSNIDEFAFIGDGVRVELETTPTGKRRARIHVSDSGMGTASLSNFNVTTTGFDSAAAPGNQTIMFNGSWSNPTGAEATSLTYVFNRDVVIGGSTVAAGTTHTYTIPAGMQESITTYNLSVTHNFAYSASLTATIQLNGEDSTGATQQLDTDPSPLSFMIARNVPASPSRFGSFSTLNSLQTPGDVVSGFNIEQYDAGTVRFQTTVGTSDHYTVTGTSVTRSGLADIAGTDQGGSIWQFDVPVTSFTANQVWNVNASYDTVPAGGTSITETTQETVSVIKSLRYGAVAENAADFTLSDIQDLSTFDSGNSGNNMFGRTIRFGTTDPNGETITLNGDNGTSIQNVRFYIVYDDAHGALNTAGTGGSGLILRNVHFTNDRLSSEMTEVTGIPGYRVYMTASRASLGGTDYEFVTV